MYFGVYFGVQRRFVFCMGGTYDRNKRNGCNSKPGFSCNETGPGSCYRALGPSGPPCGPATIYGALFNCLIVGRVPLRI